MPMQNKWQNCKKILCIRLDNMGDILMSTPAMQALKNTFNCHITLLVSSMGKPIVDFIPCVDEVMLYDPSWVKSNQLHNNDQFKKIVTDIQEKKFDGAVIFNVYSQNPLPAIMLAYFSNIPLRLAYCRENPYALLTDWVPDKEPYSYILHQVKRDLALVESISALTLNNDLILEIDQSKWLGLKNKLMQNGVDVNNRWIIAHAGVSENKRFYPKENWINIAKRIIREDGCQILFTGSSTEINLTTYLAQTVGKNAFSFGGMLTLEEFLLLIKNASLVISVNTLAMHIAAAANTPVIALYALTNPQHLPWKAKGKVFPYQVPQLLQSKNEIIKYVTDNMHPDVPEMQEPNAICDAAFNILQLNKLEAIPEMFPLKDNLNCS